MLDREVCAPVFSDLVGSIELEFAKDKLELVYTLEQLRAVIVKAVRNAMSPSPEQVAFLDELEALLSSLKNGLFELDALLQSVLRKPRNVLRPISSKAMSLFSRVGGRRR